jgi:hypothetical protein
VDWVRLTSSLIACNLGCNPRRENKVLVPILFLIGGFHLDHLYKCHVSPDVTLCIVTPFMNKWMFTFCKYDCHSFALCLPYAKLTSESTRRMQISNDAKLNMADVAYKDFRGCYP